MTSNGRRFGRSRVCQTAQDRENVELRTWLIHTDTLGSCRHTNFGDNEWMSGVADKQGRLKSLRVHFARVAGVTEWGMAAFAFAVNRWRAAKK